MRLEVIVLLFALTLAYFAQASKLYVGCFDHDWALDGAVGEYIYEEAPSPTVPCECRSRGFDYSYSWERYWGPQDPFTHSCLCTNTPPNFLGYNPICQDGYEHIRDVQVFLDSSQSDGWEFKYKCYRPRVPISGVSVTNVPQCLDYCDSQGMPYAALVVYQPLESHILSPTCGCYATQSIWQHVKPEQDCLFNHSWKVFSRTPHPSALARKRGARFSPQQVENLCPAGTTVCRIRDAGSSGFERIDTSSELESCGGCTFVTSANNSQGENGGGKDCTKLPGVLSDGVTCYEGRCIAFACEDGFTPVDDTCSKVKV